MISFACKRPNCISENVRFDYDYNTASNGCRKILFCHDCGFSFSETKNTFLEGIRKSISTIWDVINARTEGLSLNATCRVFAIAKNTLLSWERKFSVLYRTLFLYSMGDHSFSGIRARKAACEGSLLMNRPIHSWPEAEAVASPKRRASFASPFWKPFS